MAEDFKAELQSVFLEEVTQLLEDTEQCFLQLESAPDDPATIEKIFRLAHNLKGSANAVGFQQLGEFTHKFESFLLKLKTGELKIKTSTVGILLRCNDYIASIVAGLKVDASATFDYTDLLNDITEHISGAAIDSEVDNHSASSNFQECIPSPDEFEQKFPTEENEKIPGLHLFEEEASVVATSNGLAAASQPTKLSGTPTATAADESIRVSLHRVEKLINFVGEMVILQTVLREQVNSRDSSLLRKTVHQLGKVTKEVQDLSMSLRMVQVKSTFQKMQRIVRDTSTALDKKIKLTLLGEETEMDKTILEKVSDPLVHLIRNAVDHGIETAAIRKDIGKSEVGEIFLSAYHHNGRLMIEVRDDGAGLSASCIKAKAIEKGILKPDSVISDKDIYQLIFHNGFSTKTVVTDVSGRGVGMDVVRTNIEQLQGEVQLETELGKGTCIKLCLPLTMAIIDAMTIEVDSQRFVIPLSHVHESTRPNRCDVHHITNMGDIYNLRGENLPLYYLSQLLSHKIDKPKAPTDSIAIVIGTSGQRFAVLVDDIIGQNQIVIKQLGGEHRNLKGFSGSAIMGDGREALILELPELVSRFKEKSTGSTTQKRATA